MIRSVTGKKEEKKNRHDKGAISGPSRSSPQLLSFIPEGREAPGGELAPRYSVILRIILDSTVSFSNFQMF
jgi:hypothetical protein